MNTGVYIIKNRCNNKFYIGSAGRSFIKRFNCHLSDLRNNKHHSDYLQRSWNKYGENNFEFIILELCVPEECIKREQYYIDTLSPEYNICPIAGSVLGAKFNSSEKVKISQRQRAKKLGLSHAGKKLSEEQRKVAQNAAHKNPVIAINIKTGETKEFISQMEASRQLDIDKRHISRICNKKRSSAKNWTFTWQI